MWGKRVKQSKAAEAVLVRAKVKGATTQKKLIELIQFLSLKNEIFHTYVLIWVEKNLQYLLVLHFQPFFWVHSINYKLAINLQIYQPET